MDFRLHKSGRFIREWGRKTVCVTQVASRKSISVQQQIGDLSQFASQISLPVPKTLVNNKIQHINTTMDTGSRDFAEKRANEALGMLLNQIKFGDAGPVSDDLRAVMMKSVELVQRIMVSTCHFTCVCVQCKLRKYI